MRTKQEIVDDIETHAGKCEIAQSSPDPRVRYNPRDMRRALELIDEGLSFIELPSATGAGEG